MTLLPGCFVWTRADDLPRPSRYGGNALPSEMIALEPRVMLDGAAMVAAVAEAEPAEDTSDQADAAVEAQPAAGADADTDNASGDAPGATIVIIDAGVQDAETLLTGIDPSAEVYFLGSGTDGVHQITSILSNHDSISELHIISHGTIGGLSLGSSALNSGNAESYAADFVQWDAALSDGADILLYGCNVGQDGAGQDFVDQVSELTNADVAASIDVTGHESLGGDWTLEIASGQIQSAGIVSNEAQAAFGGTLAAFTETFDTINTVLANGTPIPLAGLTLNGFVYTPSSDSGDIYQVNDSDMDEKLVASGFGASVAATTLTITKDGGGSFIFNSINFDVFAGFTVHQTVELFDAGNNSLGTMTTSEIDAVNSGPQNTLDFGAVSDVTRVVITSPHQSFANIDDITTGDPGNIPPVVNNLDGDAFTYIEGSGQQAVDQGPAVTITDGDSADFDTGNLTATITSGKDAAEDVLSFDTTGTVALAGTTAGSNVSVGGIVIGTLGNNIATGNDLVVNFNGSANTARVQTLAQAITYENTDTDNPTTGARNVRITVDDGDGATPTDNDVTITVQGVNDAPVIANLDGDSFTYTEGGGHQAVDQGTAAGLSDVDSTVFSGGNLTVTITSGEDTTEDLLSVNGTVILAGMVAGSDVLVGGFVIGTLANNVAVGNDFVVNLTANATLTRVQTLIRSITYENIDTDNPTPGDRTVRFTVNDGDGGTSANNDVTITVQPQNDAPAITNLDADSLNYDEGDGAQNLDQGTAATLSDVDSADFSGGALTVTITAGQDAGEDVLSVDASVTLAATTAGSDVSVGGIVIGTLANAVAAGNDFVVNFNGNATLARVQTLIRALTYENNDTADPTIGNRTVRITVTDGDGGTSANSDVTVTVTAVNDPPVVGNLAGDTATVIAAGAAANIDVSSDALVTDPDGATDFDGGFIVFDITAGTDNGKFSFDGINALSGGDAVIAANETITVGGVGVGVVSNVAGQDGQGGNLLRIDFSAGASPAAISTLIQNLLYAAPSGFGDRTLTTTIEDGDGTANGGDSDTVVVSTINVPVAPQVQSIVRQVPAGTDTNADTVTFRVTFDSDVVNVDVNDFALSGTLTGTSTVTTVTPVSGSVYDVIVDVPDAGDGTINLDISATPTVQNGGGVSLQNSAVPIGADETYTIDNTAPAIPTIDLSAASDSNINNDDITFDTTPTFTGVAEAGSTVSLSSSIDGQFVQGTAAAYGGAGLTPIAANALSDGVHTITVTSTDAAGNTSMANLTVTIDSTAPVLNAFTRSTPKNAQTSADTLVFQATFNEAVNFVDAADFAVNGTTTATVSNVVQTSPTTFLVTISGGDLATFDGAIDLNVSGGAFITDVAGNSLAIAEPATDEIFTLDNTAPNPPAGLDLQAASDTGVSITDNLTADTTPTITGTAEANATVTLTSDRNGMVGTATANATGLWTITTSGLSEGVHSLTATATDATGNISATSSALAITIDVTALAPSAPDLTAATDTGTSNTDNVTSDTTPTLAGTAEAGATVTLTSSISGAVGTAVADAAGAWSITTAALPEGVHLFRAFMTDRAGNVSPASAATTVTISAIGGQVSTGTDGSDIGGLGSGNDGPSNDQPDNPSGDGSNTDGTGTTFGGGTTFETGPKTTESGAGPLAPGRTSVDDIITGGIGGSTPFPGTGISDNDLPGTIVLHPSSDTGFSNSDNTTRDNTPTLTGEAPANSIVAITSSLGGILGTANVDENGKWTFTSPSLVDGIHELIATPKDENGNEGTPSLPLLATIDTVAPPVPSAPEFVGDIDQLKSNDTPTFKGKAEPGARIVLSSDPDGIAGEVIADENGNWQVTTGPLSENGHKLSVVATDSAGNTSASSPALKLVVRGEDDTALNSNHDFYVQPEISLGANVMAVDVSALLRGFAHDVAATAGQDIQSSDWGPSGALGFTRQLQMAGNNHSGQMFR